MQEALAQEKPRFLHKTVRGFQTSKGPADVNNPKNYNQKLTMFLEDSLDECEEDPQRFPGMVENYFKDNLLKRYNLIRYLKAEIRREKEKKLVGKAKELAEEHLDLTRFLKSQLRVQSLHKTIYNKLERFFI